MSNSFEIRAVKDSLEGDTGLRCGSLETAADVVRLLRSAHPTTDYFVVDKLSGLWITIGHSASELAGADAGQGGSEQANGKQYDRQTFFIVMSLDREGPVERGERTYFRHACLDRAQAEARRLAREHGGRFAVLRSHSLIGYVEQDYSAEAEVPF